MGHETSPFLSLLSISYGFFLEGKQVKKLQK